MLVNQAYRYELDPNKDQRILLAKHAGCSRFAYNWGLGRKIKLIEAQKNGVAPESVAPGIRTDADRPPPKAAKPVEAPAERKPGNPYFESAIDQHWTLNRLKKTEHYSWLNEVSKCAPQEKLRDLERAFVNMREGRAKFPKFKKKFVHDSFRLTGVIKTEGKWVTLPVLGRLKVKESTKKLQGRITSATVTREADRWYVSFAVEKEMADPLPVVGSVVGLDLGISPFAVVSTADGREVAALEAPKPLKKALKKLKKLQRQLSKRKKDSNSYRKLSLKIARLHRRINYRRLDFIHKFTTDLAKTKSVIVVEDLAVKNLTKNHCLAQAILDLAWGEVRRQLTYKTQWYGSRVFVADRFYPSSQLCSTCGNRNRFLRLSDRIYACLNCGVKIERNENAARNLAGLYGAGATGSFSPGSHACGETTAGHVSGPGPEAGRRPQRPVVGDVPKQEVSRGTLS